MGSAAGKTGPRSKDVEADGAATTSLGNHIICPPASRQPHLSTWAAGAEPLPDLPVHLLQEIQRGNVVAFVGAGFSRPANLPLWGNLVASLADDAGNGAADVAPMVRQLAMSSSAQDLDLAAQILCDAMGKELFQSGIRRKLTVDHETLSAQMKNRLNYLHGIPFAAILTTNFDNLLHGVDAQDTQLFGKLATRVLRQKPTEFERLEQIAFSKGEPTTPILKLHGDVSRPESTLVCTREGYRELLHGGSRYSTFVRTLFATHVILFIGFSFTDDYLNSLRSEIVSLFAREHGDPLCYAIFNDCHPIKQAALSQHDGLAVINYSSKEGTDFSGFDLILRQLHATTNPLLNIGRKLDLRTVLWMHTNWETARDSPFLKACLERANQDALGTRTCNIKVLRDAAGCIDAVGEESGCDAIICTFDNRNHDHQGPVGKSTFDLLLALRRLKTAPPVLVLGFDGDETYPYEDRRADCIRAGARCYTNLFWELLQELSFVLDSTPPAKSPL